MGSSPSISLRRHLIQRKHNSNFMLGFLFSTVFVSHVVFTSALWKALESFCSLWRALLGENLACPLLFNDIHFIVFSSSPAIVLFKLSFLFLCPSQASSTTSFCLYMPATIFSSSAAFFFLSIIVRFWATRINLTSLFCRAQTCQIVEVISACPQPRQYWTLDKTFTVQNRDK